MGPRPVNRSSDSSGEMLSRFVRAMLPWPTRQHSPYESLVRAHRGNQPRVDLPLLHRAHAVAHKMHDGQVRRSGEPYISHPIAVAHILAELGMDTVTLAAALLHDTVEDTTYTLEALRSDFGPSVAHLVDGVTKLDAVFFGASAEAETIRKMIVAAGQDVRVLVIKLADRLHNMRTLKFKSRASQVRIANATRDVLVPLADRLGLHVVKRELEDLVLATLEPETYALIDGHVKARAGRDCDLTQVIDQVKQQLRLVRVSAKVAERARHYWSIYSDMQASPVPDPYDPPRLIIRVNGEATDCYAALGAVHGLYRPAPGRFKDFIATPKFNLYQSLHTTVIGPGAEPLEVLLRTEEMHHTAEYGIVAHYRKRSSLNGRRDQARAAEAGDVGEASPRDREQPSSRRAAARKAAALIVFRRRALERLPVEPDGDREELAWLRRLLDWQRDATDSTAFLTSLRSDLSVGQIQVFTTLGDQALLPAGATPVDVAYSISTPTGDRLIGAYVNGRIASVTAALDDGDVVEVITAKGNDYPGPSQEWLGAVKSADALLQIAQWYDGRDADSPERQSGELAKKIEAGRLAVIVSLRRQERALASDGVLAALARGLGYPDVEALYMAIAEGRLEADEVAGRLIAAVDAPDDARRR
ncbi:MAG: RelA/SpoT family protein [Micromonosporaceae bacterium]